MSSLLLRTTWVALLLVLTAEAALVAQPANAPILPLEELTPGMKGQVWTVFRGNHPEAFSVEVSGVIQNALGPGKSLILCQLTDPRVQGMGAVAGMSGSPLYIDGRLAGALSYQVQRFETVRYAGFTPANDLAEVAQKIDAAPLTPLPLMDKRSRAIPRSGADEAFQPLTPVFSLSGLAPSVAELFAPQFRELGLSTTMLGGSSASATGTDASIGTQRSSVPATLNPGEAVAIAIAVGDITMAGTGTVSRVDGNRVTAFGHPMLGFGDVALAMCASDIVAILPSNLSSFKVANTGPVIGTLLQDRLSAVAGELGAGPSMIPIEVITPTRTLRFSTVRHAQIAPMVTGTGVSQAIIGSNDAGFNEGFRVSTQINFPGEAPLENDQLYAGPQGFTAGLGEFLQKLNACIQNPFEKTFPDSIRVRIDPLAERPWAYLDQIQASSTRARAGEVFTVDLIGRDYQGAALNARAHVTIPSDWTGKDLDLIIMNGRDLDRATGQASTLSSTDVRSFSAYLDGLRANRRTDGLYVAVVERASVLLDQNSRLVEAPGSIERITRGNANTRYSRQDVMVPLWEARVFPDRLMVANIRRSLSVID